MYQEKKVEYGKWNKSGNSELLKKTTYVKQKKEGKTEVYQTFVILRRNRRILQEKL